MSPLWISIVSSVEERPRTAFLLLFITTVCIYRSYIIFYRLFLSPITKFPGPKLAAATTLYEAYFNFFFNGQYVFQVEKLHNHYGPIVRVNPSELSIRDPEYYDKLYVSGSVRPTENYNHFADGVDFEGSHFFTTPHDLHRKRRKPLDPYFSRLGISHLESEIQNLAQKFADRFKKLEHTDAIVRLDHALVCYTGDMVSIVCCDNPTQLLDAEDYSADWYESLHKILKSMPLFESFPWIIKVVRLIPKAILMKIDSRSQLFNDWRDMCEKYIVDIKEEKRRPFAKVSLAPANSEPGRRMTLFRHLVNSGLPEEELSTPRLVNEAQILLSAGTIGTARILDLTCYYVLASAEIRSHVSAELKEAMACYPEKKPTWAQLEKLPYFQGVVKEGLRLGYGVMRRLPRVSPQVPLQFQEWTIPKGVPVGMSAYMQHTDPNIFPRPFEFLPDRWLPQNVTPLMNRNFVPFAKGSRICLGMNLALAEMNHILAALFWESGPKFELFETDESDVKLAHDFIVPLPKLDTKGIRIIFR